VGDVPLQDHANFRFELQGGKPLIWIQQGHGARGRTLEAAERRESNRIGPDGGVKPSVEGG
jgi:hypothetical protein